mgnify:FL=1
MKDELKISLLEKLKETKENLVYLTLQMNVITKNEYQKELNKAKRKIEEIIDLLNL